MIEYVGLRLQDELKRVLFPVKIRSQNFNHNFRIQFPDRSDRFRKVTCSSIREVIARDSRNHHVLNFMRRIASATRAGSSASKANGLAVANRAKTACPGASLPGNHESGSTLAPAFPPIRALRRFTNGMQPKV